MIRSLLAYACDALLAFALGALLWLILSACLGCSALKEGAGDVGGTVADFIVCPTSLVDCGHVYLFPSSPADNPLDAVELCVDDDDSPEDLDAAELVYGPSEPTPRHQGLCIFCCGPDCGRGGNAYSGTFCEGHE